MANSRMPYSIVSGPHSNGMRPAHSAANASTLAATLVRERDRAYLFRTLATLRTDIPLFSSVDELKWRGPRPEFAEIGMRLDNAVTAEPAPRSPRRPA